MKEHGLKSFVMGVALAAALLFPSVPVVYAQDAGIYVGILSFSSDVQELSKKPGESNFLKLDLGSIALDLGSTGDMILLALDTYANEPQGNDLGGTALFYAVHRAMADLVDADTGGKVLPKNIDSVYLVTITDSYDNASLVNVLNGTFPKELTPTPLNRRNEAAYADFINKKLLETKIQGKSIEAYSIGYPDALPNHLRFIASNPKNIIPCAPGGLEKSLSGIIQKIKRVNDQMTFTANLRAPFSDIRFRFQIDERNPNYYIEGTVVREDNAWHITDITSNPPDLYEPGSWKDNTEPGGKDGISFDFTINGGGFRDGTPGKLFRRIEANNGARLLEDTNAQLHVYKRPIHERKSVVVYFLLDNSKSMGNKKIEIRDSLSRSINSIKAGNDNP
ncbi:hypothetical protein AGMMS49944_13240 [Spirochaetia bacterium]|nr:hypothetical protein AGMMS49944_13240 [Spirochaetia bacterium]